MLGELFKVKLDPRDKGDANMFKLEALFSWSFRSWLRRSAYRSEFHWTRPKDVIRILGILGLLWRRWCGSWSWRPEQTSAPQVTDIESLTWNPSAFLHKDTCSLASTARSRLGSPPLHESPTGHQCFTRPQTRPGSFSLPLANHSRVQGGENEAPYGGRKARWAQQQ